MKFDFVKHTFGACTLEKDGSGWHLKGGKARLSLSHADTLAELIRKGYVTNAELDKRGVRIKVVQKIRTAIGSDFIKGRSTCQFIRTIHREGYKWIYEDTHSFGNGTLLLHPIEISDQKDLIVLSNSLRSTISHMVQEKFNLEVVQAGSTDFPNTSLSCSIEGSCIFEDGAYRLSLDITRRVTKHAHKHIEIQGCKMLQLIDDTKIEVSRTIAEIFPEVVKYDGTVNEERCDLSLSDPETENEEAVRFFLEGEYCWEKRDHKSLLRGLDLYKKAIAEDSEYLSAWIGIAKSYVVLCLQGSEVLYPREAVPRAIKVLNKLEKRERRHRLSKQQQSDIEAIKGLIYFIYEWDREKSFAAFEKSLQSAPGNYMALTWYAQCLVRGGKVTEAIVNIERARKFSGYTKSVTNTAYLQILYFARKYEEAVSKAREILEVSPNLRLGHLFWGVSAREMGDMKTALMLLEKANSLFESSGIIGELGYTYAVAGKKAKAKELLHRLDEIRSKGNYVSHYNDARICLGLKQLDECFEELEKAHDEHAPWLTQLWIEPTFDSLRTDPRYDKFILKIC